MNEFLDLAVKASMKNSAKTSRSSISVKSASWLTTSSSSMEIIRHRFRQLSRIWISDSARQDMSL